MELQTELITGAVVALGVGLLIGLEREYSRGQKVRRPTLEAAGIRTFAFIALMGNLLTWLPDNIQAWAILLGFAFTALIALLSYRSTSKEAEADKGITSEVVLVTTFILGVLTGIGYIIQAGIIAVLVFSLLRFKHVLHRFSRRLSEMDLQQAMQFLVISVVVLPILPNQPFGPYASFNPFHIWLIVVLISGIGFAGYAAIKALDQRAGLSVTGLLGGLASSTAVTLAMSRLSRTNPNMGASCVSAIVLACGVMFPRVLVFAAMLDPDVAMLLLAPILLISVFTAVFVVLMWRRDGRHKKASAGYAPEINPLSMRMAIAFGLFYGVVELLTRMAEAHFGQGGIMSVAAVSGLGDVDAISLSLLKMSREGLAVTLTAQAILLAATANSLVKLSMGMAFADPLSRGILLLGLLPMSVLSIGGIFVIFLL
ncbi:MAG: MgtC/SapB family protein [Mariprofundaceae bacterium]